MHEAMGNFTHTMVLQQLLGINGSYRTVHMKDVRETHHLIHLNGLPYYYREKLELRDCDEDIAMFGPQYSRCLLIRAKLPNTELGAEQRVQVDICYWFSA